MKLKGKVVTIAAVAAGLAFAAGCGGGGGGGSSGHTRTTQFSPTNAEEAMVFVGDNMLACQDGTFTKSPAKSTAKTIGLARTLPRQLFAFAELNNSDGSDTSSGDCTANSLGSVSVSYDHSSGTTSYSFTFTNYCKRDSTNDRETIFNGTASAKQNGTPSDFGPVYKGIDAKTTGSGIAAATYDTSSARVGSTAGPVGTLISNLDIDISGYSIDFGRPSTWSPYMPDVANPDVDTISSISVRDVDTGDVTRIEDVRIENYAQTLTTSNVTIESGWVSNSQAGTFSIATDPADPLIISNDGTVVQGTVIATGAKGTSVTLTAESSMFTAVVNDGTTDTPIATGVQCDYVTRWPAGLLGFTEDY